MAIVDKVNNDKERYWKNLFFIVFYLIVLLSNLMSKLIHNQCKLTCTCKLLIKVHMTRKMSHFKIRLFERLFKVE